MKIRKLTKEDVTIEVQALEEYTQVRGNATSSGDDAADKECEDTIIKNLESGNEWAWCTIKVTASWNERTCSTYLGCCSYDSKEDFLKDNYYTDLVDEAIDGLNKILQSDFDKLSELVEP
jgi:hypothetical protein